VYNFVHGKSQTVSSKNPRLPTGKKQTHIYWFLSQYIPKEQEQKSTIQKIQRSGKMTEPWDYKGLYWDEITKDFHRWHDLKTILKEREKCQSTAETKEPNLNEK
jgi:hypothetical protein